MDDDFKPTSCETRVRVQGDKETAHGAALSTRGESPWQVGDRLNDFVLEEFLGKGTSGFVFRALDRVTQRRCALKLLVNGTPEDLVRNKLGFRRMMSIGHPSLLRVDRIHQLGEYIALSMEEVDGETLPRVINRMRAGDVEVAYRQLLKLTRQYAAGLAAMHINGYVHRDIKPQNLMVDRNGNGRVIDYGLVGTFDPETDPHGHRHYLAGTPRYFAPEVLFNQNYLPAGDIFSLGMVVLEALHSLRLLRDDDSSAFQRSETSPRADAEVINEAIEELDQAVPDDLRELCLEMLQRDPADRPTAMRVARFGDPPSATMIWPQENRLVGRGREVSEICHWLDEIYAGAVGRLHISGPSGIGKTRLLDDIEKYIRSMRWGQVFRARCHTRENQPLQAFDQICDAIANRYRQGDREPLQLDPVSTTILHRVFPVLRNVVHCRMNLTSPAARSERLDALEAAARMSRELRNVGPLILVIDDAQWADRDSLNVLDRLQGAEGEIGLGIITVSRDGDQQRMAATRKLSLLPLCRGDSIEMLSDAAEQWGVPVSDAVLEDLADVAAGSPFRLNELAEEFRPGGALAPIGIAVHNDDDSVSRLGRIDWLWQKRADRLSADARLVLAFVVTAGTSVSTQQLGMLTGLGDAVDAAVSELVQQRLVSDEATGGECIRIVHDRVADGLVKTLDESVKCRAHQRWAELLTRATDDELRPARIAEHLFAADQPAQAVAYAARAAEQAERMLAKTEAARWHARIVEHVDGEEKVTRLRRAARCFHEADRPAEASIYYRRLADHVDRDERIECQLLSASMAIRSGLFAGLRERLHELSSILGTPRPKPGWLSQFAVSARLLISLGSSRKSFTLTTAAPSAHDGAEVLRKRQALRLCIALARPLSMFDNRYSAELNLFGESLAARIGTPAERLHCLIGRAVFGCYDRGATRRKSEQRLEEIKPHVELLDDHRVSGDFWAGIAYSHLLSCRWRDVAPAVETGVAHYQAVPDANGFEVAHTQWLQLWADWHTGRWHSLFSTSDMMFDDAVRHSDVLKRLVATEGYGSCAWLGRGRISELDAIRAEEHLSLDQPTQVVDIFVRIASLQCLVYRGRYGDAWQIWKILHAEARSLPFGKMQFFRVILQSLGALIGLHQLGEKQSSKSVRRISSRLSRLRNERLPYASLLANFYDGLLQLRLSEGKAVRRRAATIYFRAAAEAADQLGLTPLRLASDDALAAMEGEESGRLREAMHRQGVADPDLFERLYTVARQCDWNGQRFGR